MLIRKGLRYVWMDQAAAGDGTGGSAGGDAGAGGAAAAGTDGGAGTGAPVGGAGDGAGNDGAGTALGKAGEAQPQAIPEKYQVKKEDGSLDLEASARKLAEAYSHAEKRIGSGDVPPKTPADYQIAVPDALKETWKPTEDPLLQEFLKDAHAAGMTQKQVDLAMAKYMDLAPKLVAGAQALSEEDCTAELKTEWKTDEQYKAEVGKAFRAAQAYGDKDAASIIKDYGNDPRIVRLLARVGAELGEDTTPNPGGSDTGGQSVEALMASEAYTNPKHADHARVSAQVQKHFKQQAAAAEKAGNAPIF